MPAGGLSLSVPGPVFVNPPVTTFNSASVSVVFALVMLSTEDRLFEASMVTPGIVASPPVYASVPKASVMSEAEFAKERSEAYVVPAPAMSFPPAAKPVSAPSSTGPCWFSA